MAEIPKLDLDPYRSDSSELGSSPEQKPTSTPLGFVHQDGDGGKTVPPDGFVSIDIGALSHLASKEKDSMPSPRVSVVKTLSRKGSQRGSGGIERKAAEGDAVHSSAGKSGDGEKSALLVHVADDGESMGPPQAMTPTSAGGGGRCRRSVRRPSPWLNPRRVLLFFATVSSMGTLILLYFTLSMGKMTSSDAADANAR